MAAEKKKSGSGAPAATPPTAKKGKGGAHAREAYTAGQALREGRDSHLSDERPNGKPSERDRYSVEALRANMSTGGGVPIKKGHKWTNERRVMQPRDPDTGHFTYNADAQYGLKYKQRAKANSTPIGLRSWGLSDGIKKGDKVNINGKVWIAIRDMDAAEVREYFKRFDEEHGEYYKPQHYLTPKLNRVSHAPTGVNKGIGTSLSSAFIRKRGRTSKAEKAGIEAGRTHLGEVDLSKLGSVSQAEMQTKNLEANKGFLFKPVNTADRAHIDSSMAAANQAHNDRVDAQNSSASKATAGTPNWAGAGSASANSASANPASAGTGSASGTNPTQPANKTTFNTKKAQGVGNMDFSNLLNTGIGGGTNGAPAGKDNSLLSGVDLKKIFGGK